MDQLSVLFPPFLVCVILTGIHGYLGIHVLARHVIFVDLAMAQIAALGTTVAFLFGYEPGSSTAYFVSLSFTLFGAAVFSLTRSRTDRVPHEAIIGLVYAIATAAAIMFADQAAHGTEHLKNILAGSIVWVTWPQITKTAIIYAVLGAFHYIYRDRFFLISTNPQQAAAQGVNVRLWDFLFYATFGVIITSSVQIAGILLVFCYLIAPAVVAVQFSDRLGMRLAIGWTVGVLVSAVGLLFSYNRPSGPTIICFFAIFLILAGIFRYIKTAKSRTIASLKILAGAGLLTGAGFLFVHLLTPVEEHSHGESEHEVGNTIPDLIHALEDEHENVRAKACQELGKRDAQQASPKIRDLLINDPKPAVKEKAAKALAQLKDREAIPALLMEAKREHEDAWVRLYSAQALISLESPDAIEGLLTIIAGSVPEVVVTESENQLLRVFGKSNASDTALQRSNALLEIRRSVEKEKKKAVWVPEKRIFELR